MSNNKQSSLEWLIEKYTIVCGLGSKELMKEHIARAKAMHKKECVHLLNTHNDIFDTSEDHYNATFGGNDG